MIIDTIIYKADCGGSSGLESIKESKHDGTIYKGSSGTDDSIQSAFSYFILSENPLT